MPPAEIYVAVACSGEYVRPACVSMLSLATNLRPGVTPHFVVLDLGITDYERRLLDRCLAPWKSTVLTPDAPIGTDVALSNVAHAQRFDHQVYAYLELPRMLAGVTDRFLRLDADTLVIGDVSPLFEMDLHGAPVAASRDFCNPVVSSPEAVPDYESLGIPAGTKALNCGVLLVDTARWGRADVTGRTLDYARSKEHLPLLDQSALNATLRGDWTELGHDWNYQPFPEFEESYRGGPPRIVHFTGRQKPWRSGSQSRHYQIVYHAYGALVP